MVEMDLCYAADSIGACAQSPSEDDVPFSLHAKQCANGGTSNGKLQRALI